MKKKLVLLSSFVLGLAPVAAFAQISTTGSTTSGCNYSAQTGGTLIGMLCRIGQILNAIVPVLIALAVVWFVWGVIAYLIGDDEEAKKRGRNRIIFGIIGLVVIVGLWGLVNLLSNTFGLSNQGNEQLPTVPISQTQ
jgi:mannose/fructose/N-acetylgalactosamine-specific phosphotransferase system component IID